MNKLIQHVINVDGTVLAMLGNGNFGKININGDMLEFDVIYSIDRQTSFLNVYMLLQEWFIIFMFIVKNNFILFFITLKPVETTSLL